MSSAVRICRFAEKGSAVKGLGFKGLGFRGLGFQGLGFRVKGLPQTLHPRQAVDSFFPSRKA